MLKIGELAQRSGITVRALHHYDAIGLLSPSARSEGGYRLYGRDDVARLHGIQALRHLGLPLKEIGALLAGDASALPPIVAQQIRALDHEIAHATALRGQLVAMLGSLANGAEPDTTEWLASLHLMSTYARHFSAEEIRRIVDHWQRVEAAWPALLADVQRAIDAGTLPTDLAVQPLAHRWMSLIHHWLDGDFALIERWGTVYKTEPGVRQHGGPDIGVVRYIEQATDLRMARWRAHFTLDEMSRFRWTPPEEWEALQAGVERLIEDGTLPSAAEARSACDRADALAARAVGGDALLLQKLAGAMAAEPLLRAGMKLKPAVVDYLDAVRRERDNRA